MIFEKLCF